MSWPDDIPPGMCRMVTQVQHWHRLYRYLECASLRAQIPAEGEMDPNAYLTIILTPAERDDINQAEARLLATDLYRTRGQVPWETTWPRRLSRRALIRWERTEKGQGA